jgi:hypothetical protein
VVAKVQITERNTKEKLNFLFIPERKDFRLIGSKGVLIGRKNKEYLEFIFFWRTFAPDKRTYYERDSSGSYERP